MSRNDPAWKYAAQIILPEEQGKKGYKYLKCNFCAKEIKGGVLRVKEHLACTQKNVAPCPKVPTDVKEEIKLFMQAKVKTKHVAQRNFEEMVDYGGDGDLLEQINSCAAPSQTRGIRGPMDRFMRSGTATGTGSDDDLPPLNPKELRNMVADEIGRFFIENGIPFNVAKSPSFFSMLRAVGNYGRGLKPPTPHELGNSILKRHVEKTDQAVEEVKATWPKTGVSILSDGWSDMRNRNIINFLVNNPYGTVFLRSVDASDIVKDAPTLFDMLDEVVEEVGEENVIQVVTDNAAAYKAAGRMLMEKRKRLYWTPCAAHCIDLMLEKIGDLPQHRNALMKAKRVTNFVYNHQWVLSLARKYGKKDLVRAGATRFATAYLTLESVLELKQPLQQMFVSNEWAGCAWAKKSEGKEVKNIIMDEQVFWPQVLYAINTTKPLVRVLRLVDGATPAMGFIYGAMDEAKEKIAENLGREIGSYKQIWEIIDEKWDNQLHRDLHACAYSLNPRFRWREDFSRHPEIKRGLLGCMDRLLDIEEFSKVDEQLDSFINKQGLFGHKSSQESYKTRDPVHWWDHCGDEVPELMSFAKKILGLTCSASECERNWSVFNLVHTKKRNRLKSKKLNDIVYILYNNKLKYNYMKKRLKDVDPLAKGEEPASDCEWVAEPNLEDYDHSDSDDSEEEVESTSAYASTFTKRSKRKRSVGSGTASRGKGKSHQRYLVDEDDDEENCDDEV